MPKKEKDSRFEELRKNPMTGMDGELRPVFDYFNPDDFEETKDKKEIFVRHDALLRAAKKAFQGVTKRTAKALGVPTKEDDYCAVVEVVYKFGSGHIYGAVADCRSKTANPGYAGYTTALAETRASARALRWALGLEIVTQEEVTNIEDIIDRTTKEPATEQQKALIKKKFMVERKKTFEDIAEILGKKTLVTLDELTRGEAAEVLEQFNSEK